MDIDSTEARGPLVTIGIPSYNSVRFIEQALNSALGQTYLPIEVLVIDDASNDGTWESLSRIHHPRVRLLRNDTNLGAVGNWNRVLAEARGEFIKVLHGDDFIRPQAIAAQVAALTDDPDVVLVSSRRWIVSEAGCRVGIRGARWRDGRIDGVRAVLEMVRMGRNLIGEPSATLMRAATAREVGGFVPDAGYCVDLDLWTRMLARGDLYFFGAPLASYRISRTQWSVELADQQSADFERLLTRVHHESTFGVSSADVLRGARAASRQALLRRLLYTFLPQK